jgi:dTDP-4-amino-4,6-dideoxygalactose transaminase
MDRTIPFGRAVLTGRELDYIVEATKRGHLSGDGEFTRRCHAWFVETLGCHHALLTHSCTAALELAAIVSGVGEGDEVVMPSFTFVSTANAFVLRGAVPVFVDIRPDTLSLDEDLLEAAITPRTRVIVPMHYAGVGCDMDRIGAIAKERDVIVIEDAAQALMATYKGSYLGTIGELGCLSFHDTKNVICGEGGALLFRDSTFVERAEIVREKGTNRKAFFRGLVDKYSWIDIGSSYLPGELTAAFLYAQLENARAITERRRALCAAYRERLAALEAKGFFRLPQAVADRVDSGHISYLLTRTPDEREELRRFLGSDAIHAVSHYVPLHSAVAGQRYGRTASSMTNTDRVAETLLRLPLFHDMTEEQLARVTDRIDAFYTR